MRLKLLQLASLLLLTSCMQKLDDPRTISGTDPKLAPYVEMYMKIKGSGLGYDIPIALGDLAAPQIGLCTRWASGARQIVISRSYWENSKTGENEKISLIFHELGHCDLDRDHVKVLLSNNWPKSFMYPYNYGFRDRDRDYYFAELFSPNLTSASEVLADMESDCVEDLE